MKRFTSAMLALLLVMAVVCAGVPALAIEPGDGPDAPEDGLNRPAEPEDDLNVPAAPEGGLDGQALASPSDAPEDTEGAAAEPEEPEAEPTPAAALQGGWVGAQPYADYSGVMLSFNASGGTMLQGQGNYIQPGDLAGLTWSGSTITLSNFNYTTTAATGLYIYNGDATIVIEGSNSFTCNNTAVEIQNDAIGINAGSALTIEGSGTLSATADYAHVNPIGLNVAGALEVKSGVTVIGTGGTTDPNNAGNSVGVNAGSISVAGTLEGVGKGNGNASSYGVKSDGATAISGQGKITGTASGSVTTAYGFKGAAQPTGNIAAIGNTDASAGALPLEWDNADHYVFGGAAAKYVELTFIPDPSAKVGSVTIDGDLNVALTSPPTATITLEVYTLADDLNEDAAGWFENLPGGMSVRATGSQGGSSITLTFGGTPTVTSGDAFIIKIPAGKLTGTSVELAVIDNPDAKFNITCDYMLYYDPDTEAFYNADSPFIPANQVAMSNFAADGSTLTLNGFTFATTAAIGLVLPDGMTLVLDGDSSITSDNIAGTGIKAEGGLTIEGSASLSAVGGAAGADITGDLTVTGGTLHGEGIETGSTGISVGGAFSVTGSGVLTAEGTTTFQYGQEPQGVTARGTTDGGTTNLVDLYWNPMLNRYEDIDGDVALYIELTVLRIVAAAVPAGERPRPSAPPPIVGILYDVTKTGDIFSFKVYIANARGSMPGAQR